MCNRRLDYDQIAHTYDRRFKVSKQKQTAETLLSLAFELGAKAILEVGCGTGRWLADLRPVTHHLYGLDLSKGMLDRACQRDKRLNLVQGRAERPPFFAGKFDLVYCVNAIHHFDWPCDFILDASRLLRSGGALAVIGMDPRGHREDWYVYHYFKGTYKADLARFPSWNNIMKWMDASGLEDMELRPVESIVDHKVGRAILEDPFLQKEATSQVALLTPEAYATGLEQIEIALRKAEKDGETIVFPVTINLNMLVGRITPHE